MATKLVNGIRLPLTEKELEQTEKEWAKGIEDKKKVEWLHKREKEYPSIKDQLDIIFKDMESGAIKGSEGEWYKAIKKIKDKYPKPKV